MQNTVKAYPCGSDHTPSPMASRKSQEAKAVLEMFSYRLTAVAVSVRKGHSIAFLGDTKGTLHKVSLPILHNICLHICTIVFNPVNTVFRKVDTLSIGTVHKKKVNKTFKYAHNIR